MSSLTTTWIGQTLEGGRFLVGEKLGEGGMAVVLRADDLKQRIPVVIKVPKQTAIEDTTFLKRFAAENRALMKLQHPAIVRILHVGEHEGWPFTALQYLPGGDLDQFREKTAQTGPVQNLARWLPRIAEALDYIHSQGYVHRDVKPANILFDGEGQVFLSDFGIAKALSQNAGQTTRLTATGMVLGTPDYMAPELILGKPIDGKIDQYGLGTLVYEWLAGRVPFRAATPAAVLIKQTTVKAKTLHEVDPRIRDSVSQVVMKALAKNPAERFASCGEFCECLLDAVEDGPIPKRKTPTPHAAAGQTQALTAQGHSPLAMKSVAPSAQPGQRPSKTRPPKPPSRTVPVAEQHFEPEPQFSPRTARSPKKYQMPLAIGVASCVLCLLLVVVFGRSAPEADDEPVPNGPNAQEAKSTVESVVANPPAKTVETKTASNPAPSDPPALSREIAALPSRMQLPSALLSPDEPEPGEERQDNSLLMVLCYCPPGAFSMGSDPGDPAHRGNEDSQDVLITNGYWMARHEVTQAHWQQVMGTTPWRGEKQVMEGESFPAVFVSWEDATAFCKRLTEEERRAGRISDDWAYSLPTEAQWEYACRAGRTTKFPFGDDGSRLIEFAWFQQDPLNPTLSHAQEVGKKSPNAWGLYDMQGNVYEWCVDWYQEKLPGGIDPVVSEPDRFRVFRGGTFAYDARHSRAASRNGNLPGYRAAVVGFRVALVPADSQPAERD